MNTVPGPIEPERSGGNPAGYIAVALFVLAAVWLDGRLDGALGVSEPAVWLSGLALGFFLVATAARARTRRGGGETPPDAPAPFPEPAVPRQAPARPPGSPREAALTLLADPAAFSCRPARGPAPAGLPKGVTEVFGRYEFVGAAGEETEVFLDASSAGPSEQAANGVRIGSSRGSEIVVFPGDEAVYEVFAGSEDDELVELGAAPDGNRYPDVWEWILNQ